MAAMVNTSAQTTDTTAETEMKASEEKGLPIRIRIAESVSKIAPAVTEAIVETMVSRLVTKYKDAFVICLDKLATMERDLAKIKPDQVHFTINGEKVSETFSKSKLDERNKQVEQIARLKKLLNNGLEKGEWNDVCAYSTQGSHKSGDNEKTS
jgi:hypothetical protein